MLKSLVWRVGLEIVKRTVRGSQYIGVFALVTEDIGVFPVGTHKAETERLEELLGIRMVKTNIASSPLTGVFAAALGSRIALPESAEKSEVKTLREHGVEVMKVNGHVALGNLLAVNSKGGIASRLLERKTVDEISEFLGVGLAQMQVAGTELPGACIVATEKGFLVHPEADAETFNRLKKTFKAHGAATTANYGDPFIGNDILANSLGAIVGMQTSGHEIIRIDDGLRGE